MHVCQRVALIGERLERVESFSVHSSQNQSKHACASRGKKGALEFVEEGSLQRQAEIMRLKQKYGEFQGEISMRTSGWR
jgi:hypothetical protein